MHQQKRCHSISQMSRPLEVRNSKTKPPGCQQRNSSINALFDHGLFIWRTGVIPATFANEDFPPLSGDQRQINFGAPAKVRNWAKWGVNIFYIFENSPTTSNILHLRKLHCLCLTPTKFSNYRFKSLNSLSNNSPKLNPIYFCSEICLKVIERKAVRRPPVTEYIIS